MNTFRISTEKLKETLNKYSSFIDAYNEIITAGATGNDAEALLVMGLHKAFHKIEELEAKIEHLENFLDGQSIVVKPEDDELKEINEKKDYRSK